MIHLKAISLSQREQLQGMGYLLFQFLVLPYVLSYLNTLLPHALSEVQLNFLFYCINFLAVILIFRRFLGSSLKGLKRGFGTALEFAVLGLCGYFLCNFLLSFLIRKLFPAFSNVNDSTVLAMYRSAPFLMTVGTVVLVPLTEECLFRVLIFRRLYGASRPAAYLLSICLFGFIHIMGYWGEVPPLTLVLCFIQYIPAGVFLAWAYQKGGNIFSSVLMHACINALGIYLLR